MRELLDAVRRWAAIRAAEREIMRYTTGRGAGILRYERWAAAR